MAFSKQDSQKPIDVLNVDTDTKRFQLLYQLNKHIPELFSDATHYNFDLFDGSYRMPALLKELQQIPAFMKEVQSPHQYLTIDIFPKPTQIEVKNYVISPESLETWKTTLLETWSASDNNHNGNSQNILETRIKQVLNEIGNHSAMGLMTGLIQSLPNEKKKEAFQARNWNTKLQILEDYLPEKLPDGFRAGDHGLSRGISKSEALEKMRHLINLDEELQNLVELDIIIHKDPMDARNALDRIQNLTKEDLTYFSDKDALVSEIAALNSRLSTLGPGLPIKGLANGIRNKLEVLASQLVEVKTKMQDGIRLKEVPPEVGELRGFPGQNCASSKSGPFPNDPHEKVFFVYRLPAAYSEARNENEIPSGDREPPELIGYASGPILKAKKTRAFYLGTVSGPRVTSAETQMIFDGFDAAKRELDVKTIVLPTPERLKVLVNHPSIQITYEKRSEGAEKVHLDYYDPEVREVIEKHVKEVYDAMSENKWGLVPKKNHEQLAIDVKIHSEPKPQWIPEPITKDQILKLALELQTSYQTSNVPRFLNLADIKQKDFDSLYQAITNSDRLPMEKYLEKAQTLIGKMGVSEALLTQPVARLGRFNAPDALAEPHRSETLELLSSELHGKKIADEALDLLKREPVQNPKIEKYLNSLAKGTNEDLNELAYILRKTNLQLKPNIASLIMERALEGNLVTRGKALHVLGILASREKSPQTRNKMIQPLLDASKYYDSVLYSPLHRDNNPIGTHQMMEGAYQGLINLSDEKAQNALVELASLVPELDSVAFSPRINLHFLNGVLSYRFPNIKTPYGTFRILYEVANTESHIENDYLIPRKTLGKMEPETQEDAVKILDFLASNPPPTKYTRSQGAWDSAFQVLLNYKEPDQNFMMAVREAAKAHPAFASYSATLIEKLKTLLRDTPKSLEKNIEQIICPRGAT